MSILLASFARSMPTILCKGCSVDSKMSILLQFRAIDAYDLTYKGCSVNSKMSILLQFRATDAYDLTKGLHFRKHFPDHGGPPYYLSKVLSEVLSKVRK